MWFAWGVRSSGGPGVPSRLLILRFTYLGPREARTPCRLRTPASGQLPTKPPTGRCPELSVRTIGSPNLAAQENHLLMFFLLTPKPGLSADPRLHSVCRRGVGTGRGALVRA